MDSIVVSGILECEVPFIIIIIIILLLLVLLVNHCKIFLLRLAPTPAVGW